jgi:hypothetical protein
MENYLHLDPYPEIRGALAALKGRKLAILGECCKSWSRTRGWTGGSRL